MRISKFIITLSLFGIIFSCSKERDNLSDTAVAVKFDTQPFSRGAGINTDNCNNMSVYGYYTGAVDFADGASFTSDFMFNQKISKEDNAWSYSPVKYWPGKDENGGYGKVSFFAYAPYATAENGIIIPQRDVTGIPFLTYTMPSEAANHPDLLVATPILNQTAESGENGVQFKFVHTLAKIGFMAQLSADSDEEVSIKKVELKFDKSELGDSYLKKSATLNMSTGEWTNLRDDYSATMDIPVSTHPLLSTEATQINSDMAFLFMIPQTMNKGNIIVKLTTNKDQIIEVSLPRMEWKQNKFYNYTFTIGSESITPTVLSQKMYVSDNDR